jgi:toxin-antitoxin system PIN domain toxin
VKPYLLDVNVLIALAWPAHVHHGQCQAWFAARKRHDFATCPLTQTGFVRISSNPNFTPAAVSPREAMELLDRIMALPKHCFWPDDLPLRDAIGPEQMLIGHRQITDAYLVGLARKNGGRLATLDRGVRILAPKEDDLVELIQG